MRTLRFIVVWLAVAAIASACSGPPGSSAAGSQQAGNEPSVPAGQSEGAAASQPAGSVGAAPALADGPWTGGHGQTTTSGAVSWTTDADITTGVSKTEDAVTLLAYNTDDTFVTIIIGALGESSSVAVTAPNWDASSRGCDITYATANDNKIDATFSCVVDEFIYMGTGTEPTGDIKIDGSFTATR